MNTIDMIPSVRGRIRQEAEIYLLPEKLNVRFGDFEPWCAKAFFERIGNLCGGQQSEGRDAASKSGDYGMNPEEKSKPDILLVRDMAIPEEGYVLTVTENQIQIKASSEQGVVWAFTTLINYLAAGQSCEAELSCGGICDAPRYAHRGLSLDCARHFFPAEEVKKIIEEISLAKMNVLHWHLTDDQGWRIESRRFPKLHQNSVDYYTQEEIREICEFARVRGVEVIPEIDMPGHVSALLNAYPEYSCSGKKVRIATAGGIYPIILCAGQEQTFSFLEELLEEIVHLFLGKRIHLGGDEAPKGEWKKCPCCQAKMQELEMKRRARETSQTDNLPSAWEDLQGYFMTRVTEILEKYGKTAICWNETLRASNYPQNMQAQYWTLQHRDSMETFAKTGRAWIYSDMFELYLDYPYSMTSVKKLYETIPHLGEKIAAGAEAAETAEAVDVGSNLGQTVSELSAGDMETLQTNLLGMEACIWSEHIKKPEKMEKLLFPRIFALAEICWNGLDAPRDYEKFAERLEKWIAVGRLHQGISYTPRNWWVPSGEERQKEAFAYMASINSGMTEEEKAQTVESTAPNEEFGRAFMTKFFQPEDLPVLMGSMGK
ncbi:MAG: beta-N-acetylhexosaminidase [Clostridiales bacterium]|nr:beta-N-acetylhexosaminidase [Clostridiales bacterium]